MRCIMVTDRGTVGGEENPVILNLDSICIIQKYNNSSLYQVVTSAGIVGGGGCIFIDRDDAECIFHLIGIELT